MKRPFIKAFNALKKAGVPVYEHVEDNGKAAQESASIARHLAKLSQVVVH